ncbi:adhesin [Chromobacterium sp. ATCC 53434]|uniref:CS1 type fimbrial major subunit n=1 Tax=Chromobacterium sp. (strain ATCC 53434 / SC 14030) TaxID=2059672 RepID=UPI000C765949|nr:CS1 type fimbrial major subunit [Chromobacterium sp. ATCC 53434]AUH51942.1 adhesin [Chromobacterium sp. ATCC 53434]
MFTRKFLLGAAVSAAMLSGAAMAEQQPLQINVTANIPTDSFYVQPLADWHLRDQALSWDARREILQPVSNMLDMKSTIGAIQGYLEAPAELYGNGNGEKIPMVVKINEQAMEVGAGKKAQILTATQARDISRVNLSIAAPTPASGFKPGRYSGSVNLMFESVAPAGN